MENYKQDADNYIRLMEELETLQESEYARAYRLQKQALAQYERWSAILYDLRRMETKSNKNPALKDRIEHIMRTLNNIYTSTRMVWNKSKDDLTEGRY